MVTTTLCYIENDGKYLMLHRVKKHNDINEGKWIGVGGKFEQDETPEECLLREVKEETGLTLTKYRLRAILTFLSDEWETEYTGAAQPSSSVIRLCFETRDENEKQCENSIQYRSSLVYSYRKSQI